MALVLLVLAMAGLVLLEGFFSGSEIALVHCDKAKLRHKAKQGDRGSRLALRMFERPEVILSTTLVGTNIALVVLSVIAAALMIELYGKNGDFYAVLLVTPFTLILGEIVPKSVYQQESDRLTPKIIYPLFIFYLLLFPIVFVFSRTAKFAARLIGRARPGADLFAVREQLRAILDTAEGAAAVDVFDRTRIRNVVRFGELTVGDVMVPAAEMTAIDSSRQTADVIALVRETGQTRIPVYEGRRSNVVGIISLDVWDLAVPGLADRELSELIKPAYFVPVQQALAELLPALRTREDQTAMVVDEYGSVVGGITVDGILETVVGRVEVGTPFETLPGGSRPTYEVVGDDVYIMDARLSIAEVNYILATKIRAREAHTIGGLVVARLRHVPAEGEAIVEAGYKFTAIEVNERAVTKLRVERD